MVDWLVLWGITQGLGVIVTPILQELAKEGAKDFAKDFFKDSLNKVLFSEKDPRQIAAGKAIKEFLQLVQQQLKIKCKLSEIEIKQYTQDIKRFINHKTVKSILGKAFNLDCESLDAQTLKNTWNTLQLKPLPEKFNWEHITEQYLLKVQEILFDSEDLRNILDSQNLKNIEKYTQQLAGIIPGFDLIGYQETIRERFGNLKLESLDTTGCAYNELKLWRIFIAQNVREVHQVAPQVYELPKEHIRQLRDSDQIEVEINFHDLERYKQSYFEQPIKSVLDIINEKHNHKYLVILGDPGSGKSTLLQFLALNWAESPLDNIVSQPIPLLIELRSYMRNREEGHCKNFLEFFHQCSGAIHHLNQNQLHEQLKAGKVLVMFDGLDEIFDLGQRENIITDIHRFTNEYPQVQVIVTSRVIGYKPQRLRDAEFRHFMLQELDKNQVQEFIDRWHNLTFNDQADKIRKQARLERAINTSKAIKELAGNPLLLTMMAILNRHQELPRDRPELYHQASRVLLHQWDVERALIEDPRIDPKTIDYRDKQAMLRQVAHYMQANEKGLSGNIIKVNDLEKILINYLRSIEIDKPREAARVMINQLRTRNFILCLLGADYYAFVHRTFLEYFCAWSFVWQFKEDQTLTIEQLKTDVFGQHWRDETWHEVLRLIAGMIEPKFTGEIIEYLMQLDGEADKFVNVFLAADLLTEVKNTQLINSTVDKLHQTLKDLTEYDIDYYYEYGEEADLVEEIRKKAVKKIINTWHDDPNTLCWLKQCAIKGNNSDLRYIAVEEIAQTFKKDIEVLPMLKQLATSDNNVSVLKAALQGLAQNFKDDPDILPILKQTITSDNNRRVLDAAVRSLAENFKDNPETLSILKQYATSNNLHVRSAAVYSLAENFKDNPETLSILKQYATSNDLHMRSTAVYSLADHFKDDPDTFTLIQECSTSNIGSVRRVAVFALEKNFIDHPDTLSTLKKYATSDEYDLRQAALLALARNFKEDPDILSTLKKDITSPDPKLRDIVANVLFYELKNDPNLLNFVKQYALSDSNRMVRYWGVLALAEYEKETPETLALLKQFAISDDHERVRYIALTGLAKYYKTDSTLFELFYNCAQNDSFECKEESHYNPRLIALKIISKQYPEHPQTIPLLRDRMENDADEQVREFAKMKLTELET